MMEIRDATFADFPEVLAIMHLVFDQSIFAGMEMKDAMVQRNFVIAVAFDDGFAKVAVHKGKVVGGLVGFIADNQWGIRCAQDSFNYSVGGTDRLVREFKEWADSNGALFTQLTDFSGSSRFHSLIEKSGFQKVGTDFIRRVA
jgi:hypothetical protein